MQQNTANKTKQDIQVAVTDAIASFEKKIRTRTTWYVARYQAQTKSPRAAEVTDKEVQGKAIHLMLEVCMDPYLPEINLLKFLTTSSPAVFIVPAMMSVLETKQRQMEIAAEISAIVCTIH